MSNRYVTLRDKPLGEVCPDTLMNTSLNAYLNPELVQKTLGAYYEVNELDRRDPSVKQMFARVSGIMPGACLDIQPPLEGEMAEEIISELGDLCTRLIHTRRDRDF